MADNKQASMRLSSEAMQKHVEAEVKSRREFLDRIGGAK
jgi:hypothetical protein